MKINTRNEYSKLKSVIVGRPDNACWPIGDMFFDKMMTLSSYPTRPIPGPIDEKVIKEAQEDLWKFIDILRENDVQVYRPDIMDLGKQIVGYNHTTTGMHNYSARDLLLAVGNQVIECPTPYISRQHEHISYQQIKQEAVKDGMKWISAPVPPIEEKEIPIIKGKIQLTERYPIFDAANVMKFDDKLLYLVSSTANYAGAKWLQQVVGTEFEVITWDKVYAFAHIDSTISALDKNTIMINVDRVSGDNLPKFLKSFRKVWVHDCYEKSFSHFPYASKWIGMNTLSLDPETVFIDPDQRVLIDQVKSFGFNVIDQVSLRHARTLGGGFHCVTCDLERECE